MCKFSLDRLYFFDILSLFLLFIVQNNFIDCSFISEPLISLRRIHIRRYINLSLSPVDFAEMAMTIEGKSIFFALYIRKPFFFFCIPGPFVTQRSIKFIELWVLINHSYFCLNLLSISSFQMEEFRTDSITVLNKQADSQCIRI